MNFGLLPWESLKSLLLDNPDLLKAAASEVAKVRAPRDTSVSPSGCRTELMEREIMWSLAVLQDVVWKLSGVPALSEQDMVNEQLSREMDLPF